jgi:thiamine biosynthesis lipoprotein
VRAASFPALGTTASVVVTDDTSLGAAQALLATKLRLLDRTCSRFRPDSELARANSRAGRTIDVSPLLAELVAVALGAAQSSEGCVDPTLGSALRTAGYDRTFELVRIRGSWEIGSREPGRGRWREVKLDRDHHTLHAPAGVELDLGSTAKAWAADDAAITIAGATGAGVLVSLGGDIAIAGPGPAGGWPVRVSDDHAAPPGASDPIIAITAGGLATSSTTARRWPTSAGDAHHLLDPSTGRPASSCWRAVTVAAATCVDANVAATAAVIRSDAAPSWLDAHGLPARLVSTDGRVTFTGRWPVDAEAA